MKWHVNFMENAQASKGDSMVRRRAVFAASDNTGDLMARHKTKVTHSCENSFQTAYQLTTSLRSPGGALLADGDG